MAEFTFDPQTVLAGMEQAAREAGARIVADIRKPKNVERKGRIDLVTATDRAVEELLHERLAALLPEAAFLAEETSDTDQAAKLAGLCWVVDPVDGTTNFAHSLPFVASSIALWHEGRTVLGVVNVPVLDELFSARRGHGAYLNGQPIAVSPAQELLESVVATGFPYDIQGEIEQVVANLRRVLLRAQGVRRAGAAAIDLCYVAAGRYEAFYETTLKPWDTAAGWLLVEEAGGRVSDFDLKDYVLGGRTILASNGPVHEDLAGLLDA